MAKNINKSDEKKTAAEVKSTAAKKTAAKKPAAKSVGRPAKSAKTTAAKTTTRKAPAKKTVTIDTVCKKLEKKISKTKAAAIKGKIAADIEVWGFEDGSNGKMYVEVNNGVVTVSPHTYIEKDFRVSLSYANAAAFVDGKLSLSALLDSKDFYAEGNIAAAVKLSSIF